VSLPGRHECRIEVHDAVGVGPPQFTSVYVGMITCGEVEPQTGIPFDYAGATVARTDPATEWFGRET
jgi:hypothetical protein